MEVRIASAEGISTDHIVQVRVGQVRRQAKLGSGLPFQFPTLPANAGPLKVEVFRPLGGKELTLSPDADAYRVELPPLDPDGRRSTLKLSIRDEPSATADAMVDGPAEEAHSEGMAQKREKAAKEARIYLEQHGLVKYVQDMLAMVLVDRPADPFNCMGCHARRSNDSAPTKGFIANQQDNDSDRDFGEDVPEQGETQKRMSAVSETGNVEWYIHRQEAWSFAGENCTLTTMVSNCSRKLRFDMLRPCGELLNIHCTQAQFDDVIAEQNGLEGPAQYVAAINQLFSEGLQVLRADDMIRTRSKGSMSSGCISHGGQYELSVSASPDSDVAYDVVQFATRISTYFETYEEEQEDVAAAETSSTQVAPPESVICEVASTAAHDVEEEPQKQHTGAPSLLVPQQVLVPRPPPGPPPAHMRPRECMFAGHGTPERSPEASERCLAPGIAMRQVTKYAHQPSVGSWLAADTAPRKRLEAQAAQRSEEEAVARAAVGTVSRAVCAGERTAARRRLSAPLAEEPRPVAVSPTQIVKQANTGECRELVAAAEAAPAVSSTALADPSVVRDDAQIMQENNRLAEDNAKLKSEIERLRRQLEGGGGDCETSATDPCAVASSAATSSQGQAADLKPADALPGGQVDSGGTPAADRAQAPAPSTASGVCRESAPLTLDLDSALTGAVSELYEDLRRKNSELRENYSRLSEEFSSLTQEQAQIRQTLLDLCEGLEGMATNLRAAVSELRVKAPRKGGCLETENRELKEVNRSLSKANKKIRQENEELQSEVTSRAASRATTERASPNAGTAADALWAI